MGSHPKLYGNVAISASLIANISYGLILTLSEVEVSEVEVSEVEGSKVDNYSSRQGD